MKMTRLVESILEGSATAQQAKELGLVYAGYGRWKDPKTGRIAARTVGDQLVKVEDDDAPMASLGAQQGMEPGNDAGGGAAVADVPDSAPKTSSAVEKILTQTGGDTLKARKLLLKKAQGGSATAAEKLKQLDDYEAQLDSRIDAMQKQKDAEFAAKKDKYTAKYPKVDI